MNEEGDHLAFGPQLVEGRQGDQDAIADSADVDDRVLHGFSGQDPA
jgi:hypothetical protein